VEGPLSLSSSGAGGEATRPGRAAERQSAAVEHRGTRKSPLRGSLLQANFQVKARTPTATPSRSIGTPSTVRKPPDRCPSFHVKSGSARTSGMWMTLASSRARPVPVSRPGSTGISLTLSSPSRLAKSHRRLSDKRCRPCAARRCPDRRCAALPPTEGAYRALFADRRSSG